MGLYMGGKEAVKRQNIILKQQGGGVSHSGDALGGRRELAAAAGERRYLWGAAMRLMTGTEETLVSRERSTSTAAGPLISSMRDDGIRPGGSGDSPSQAAAEGRVLEVAVAEESLGKAGGRVLIEAVAANVAAGRGASISGPQTTSSIDGRASLSAPEAIHLKVTALRAQVYLP